MTSFIELEIISITILAALACAVPGTIIVLRGSPFITDTSAKSSVFGFAAGFVSAWWLPSAALIPLGTAAALFGIWAANKICAAKLMEKNSAASSVSSVLIAAGILIINGFTGVSGADISTVTAGDLAFVPFDRIKAGGYDMGSAAVYILGAVLFFNLMCVLVFYKEIKLSSMDEGYARSSQLKVDAVNVLISFMTALTAASAFRITGAFMAAAFILAPSLTARFYTKRLSALIITSALICVTACLTGFGLAYRANVLISGTIVCVMGAFFIISAAAAPETGIIPMLSEKKKKRFRTGMLIASAHLYLREKEGPEGESVETSRLHTAMAWSGSFTGKIIMALEMEGLVEDKNGLLALTEKGREKAEEALGIKNAAQA